jgi:Uma2 family endonuclease
MANLIIACCPRLEGRPFKPYFGQMRLKVERNGLYTYPDAMIVHRKRDFADDHQDMLTNPHVIHEVVSPETAEYNRGVKFEHYKTIDSLQEYVLIDRGMRRVEHHARRPDGTWKQTDVIGSGEVSLPSVGCRIPLDEIYNGIELSA